MRGKRSRFSALENHFLNTYFSGVYLSASDILHVGNSVGITLSMGSRELLMKELFNSSDAQGLLEQTFIAISKLIDERILQLQELMQVYPATSMSLDALGSKAHATKMLLLREMQGNTYER